MIYISSIAFQKDYKDYLDEFEFSDYGIEFSSGGLIHDENNWSILEQYRGLKIAHNYFPGYKKPFVLNISSINKEIYKKSIKHCINSINKTNSFSTEKFFAVHAGYKLDLKVSDLGNPIEQKYLNNLAKYDKSFEESIKLLIDYGIMNNVDILLENNVLIKENYDGKNIPFHLVESSNIIEIFEKYKNIGLLFDTAHFKVSCQTLGLDIEKEFQKIKTYIKAIHHSDNDGNYDTNSELKSDYWFLKHMKYFKDISHVLEVKNISIAKIYQQIKLLEL
jgi:sugar phosphate isomerase/epimerase